ncbi:hypothetical protein, partial [Desulfobacter latus]
NPSSSYSHFNMLEIKNWSAEGITFLTDVCWSGITSNGCTMNNLNYLNMSWTLTFDETIADDFELKSGTINLNGHTLTVEGNLIHSGGTLNVNGGALIVNGDYQIQTPGTEEGVYTYSSGILKMLNAADTVQVDGDFVMDSTKDHDTYLTAGTMTLKGDFTQKSTYVSYYSNEEENFDTSGTHKVILAGSTLQTV